VQHEVPPFEPIPESQTVDQATVKSTWVRRFAERTGIIKNKKDELVSVLERAMTELDAILSKS